MKRTIIAGAFVVALSLRLIIYPMGVVLDLTLSWEYSDQTCRDVGFELNPSLGFFLNEC